MATTNQTRAYEQIKEMILKDELCPGEKISKSRLVQVLGIGDTPVREAMLRLQREGLLQVIPQSGTSISQINLEEVYQAKFVRETIEKEILTEVCDVITLAQVAELEKQLKIQRIYFEAEDTQRYFQLDEEFHHFFYQITQKEFVWNWLQELNTALNRYRFLRLKVKDLSWENILIEHVAIVDLIKTKDIPSLQDTIRHHLDRVDEDATIVIKYFPEYFV